MFLSDPISITPEAEQRPPEAEQRPPEAEQRPREVEQRPREVEQALKRYKKSMFKLHPGKTVFRQFSNSVERSIFDVEDHKQVVPGAIFESLDAPETCFDASPQPWSDGMNLLCNEVFMSELDWFKLEKQKPKATGKRDRDKFVGDSPYQVDPLARGGALRSRAKMNV